MMRGPRKDNAYPRVRLCLFDHGPATRRELVPKLGLVDSIVKKHLVALRKAGHIHIKEWVRDANGRNWTAVWVHGGGEDAARPVAPVLPPSSPTSRRTHVGMQDKFLAVLPATLTEVMAALKVSATTASRCLAECRDRVHVTRWAPSNRGRPSAVYAVGVAPDVPRPGRQPRKSRAKTPRVMAPKKVSVKKMPPSRCAHLQIPADALRTVFAGGVNPWTLKPSSAAAPA